MGRSGPKQLLNQPVEPLILINERFVKIQVQNVEKRTTFAPILQYTIFILLDESSETLIIENYENTYCR